MTPDDAQIDILMRRYARHAQSKSATEHLDADELNAFAEGALPSAARARFVSHLAECGHCRKLATQLTIAAGVTEHAAPVPSPSTATGSLWQKLSAFLAPPMLRYAALAVLLVAAAGVLFLGLRHRREATLVAQNEPTSQTPVSAVKPAEESRLPAGQSTQTLAERPETVSKSAQDSNLNLKQDESKVAENSESLAKAQKETASANNPAPAVKRAAEPAIAESSPAFAPPPPGERQSVEIRTREPQSVGGVAPMAAPRKSEPPVDKFKTLDRERAAALPRDTRAKTDEKDQTAPTQNAEAKAEPVRKPTFAMSGTANEGAEAARKQAGADRAALEKAPETRTVGGRKFRRQGNTWVDVKFKPSMPLTSISRGSDEFRALDSGLRSIAEQLGGEVIIVRKGKAYRIR